MDAEEWAHVYDESNHSAHAYVFRRSTAIALQMVNVLRRPGERWLDLGCGPAHASSQLSGEGLVVGVDADERQLRIARERGRKNGLALVGAQVEHLPFADGALDGVMAISLMGCLADPEACWAEVARVLRPGGAAVMTFTNQASWLLRLNYSLPRRWITSEAYSSNRQTYRLFDESEVRRSLGRHGFSVEKLSHYNNVLHIGRWLIPPQRMAPAIDRIGSSRTGRNFVVVARKRR